MADVNVLDLSEVTPGSGDSLILFDRATGVATSTRYETLKGAVTSDVDATVAQHTSDIQGLTSETSDIVNVLGAKNILPCQKTSAEVIDGVTFTPLSDGKITISGTASGASSSSFRTVSKTAFVPKDGQYVITGNPWSDGNVAFLLYDSTAGQNIILFGGEQEKEATLYASHEYYFSIAVGVGTAISPAVTFYPMIRPASIADDTYVPYAMTNRELTEKTVKYYSSSEYITNANFTDNTTYTILEDGFYILQAQNNAAPSAAADIRILIGNITTASITVRNAYDRLIFNAPLKKGTSVKFLCTNANLSCNYRVTKMS